MFIIHICVRQTNAGAKVDEEFVDMLLSSISRLGPNRKLGSGVRIYSIYSPYIVIEWP